MRIRRGAVALAAAVVLLTVGCGTSDGTTDGGTAGASCAAPYLSDIPPGRAFHGRTPTVEPGESITVYGHFYTSTCNDTGGHDPLEPLPAVHLTLRLPGGESVDLGTFEPSGDDMGFSTTVDIPAGTPPGIATVTDDRDPPATFAIAVPPRVDPPPR